MCVQVVVLYVEQEESMRRQLARANMASLHNKRALDAASGDLWEVRATDVDEAKCRCGRHEPDGAAAAAIH